MLRLSILRVSISAWKWSLSVSKRLSGRTWVAVAILNAAIAVASFWAYQVQGVPESAIPPIYQANVPLLNALESSKDSPFVVAYSWRGIAEPASTIKPFFLGSAIVHYQGYRHVSFIDSSRSPYEASRSFSCVVYGWNYDTSMSGFSHLHWDQASRWKMPRWPVDAGRIVVQLPSEIPSLLTPVQQVVAILVGIVTTLLAILNTILAWQVYRRAKANEILLNLQIAKIKKEIAVMNKQDEQARREAEKSSLVLLD